MAIFPDDKPVRCEDCGDLKPIWSRRRSAWLCAVCIARRMAADVKREEEQKESWVDKAYG